MMQATVNAPAQARLIGRIIRAIARLDALQATTRFGHRPSAPAHNRLSHDEFRVQVIV